METDKIRDFGWSLSTELDFQLEFASNIATQALETSLLSELDEKDETFLTEVDATLDFCALVDFCVAVVSNGKSYWLVKQTRHFRISWKIRFTGNLQGLQKVKRTNSGAFRRKRWKLCIISWKKSHLPIWRFRIIHGVLRMIVKNNLFCQ